jgi:hypothetical protein
VSDKRRDDCKRKNKCDLKDIAPVVTLTRSLSRNRPLPLQDPSVSWCICLLFPLAPSHLCAGMARLSQHNLVADNDCHFSLHACAVLGWTLPSSPMTMQSAPSFFVFSSFQWLNGFRTREEACPLRLTVLINQDANLLSTNPSP